MRAGHVFGVFVVFLAILFVLAVSLVACGVNIQTGPVGTGAPDTTLGQINANATLITQNAMLTAQANPRVVAPTPAQAPVVSAPQSGGQASVPTPVPVAANQPSSQNNPACAKMTKLSDLDGTRRTFDSGWVIVNVYKVSGEQEHKVLISPSDPHAIQGWKGSAWWIGTDCGDEAKKQFNEVNQLEPMPVG